MLEMNEGNDSFASTSSSKKNNVPSLEASPSSSSERYRDLSSARQTARQREVLFMMWSVLPALWALCHPSIRPFWRIYMFLVIVPTWVITFHRQRITIMNNLTNNCSSSSSKASTWQATTTTTTWALRLMGMAAFLSVLSCGCSSVVATTARTSSLLSSMTMISMMIEWQHRLVAFLVLPSVVLLQVWMLFETFQRCFFYGRLPTLAIRAMAQSTFVVSACLCAISTKLLYFCAVASTSSSLSSLSLLITGHDDSRVVEDVAATAAAAAASAMAVPLFYAVTSCAVFAYAAWILSRATASAAPAPGVCGGQDKSHVDEAEAVTDNGEPMVKETNRENQEIDNTSNNNHNNNTTATPIGDNSRDVIIFRVVLAALHCLLAIQFAVYFGIALIMHAFPICYGWYKVQTPTQQHGVMSNNDHIDEIDLSMQLFILSMTLFFLSTIYERILVKPIGFSMSCSNKNDADSILVETFTKTYVHNTNDIVRVFLLEEQPQHDDVLIIVVPTQETTTTTTSCHLLLYDYCVDATWPRVVVEMKDGITLHMTPPDPSQFIKWIENAMEWNKKKKDNDRVQHPSLSLPTSEKETDEMDAAETGRVPSTTLIRQKYFRKKSRSCM